MGRLPANIAAFIATLLCVATEACAQPELTSTNGGLKLDPVKIVVLPLCASSHWYQYLPIIKELSRRGHSTQVTHRIGKILLAR